MSREDLDRLNARARLGAKRNKPAQDQTPEQPATDAIQTTNLIFGEAMSDDVTNCRTCSEMRMKPHYLRQTDYIRAGPH